MTEHETICEVNIMEKIETVDRYNPIHTKHKSMNNMCTILF